MCNNCTSKKITRSLIFLPCSSLRSYSAVNFFLYLYISLLRKKKHHTINTRKYTPDSTYLSYISFFSSLQQTHTHTHIIHPLWNHSQLLMQIHTCRHLCKLFFLHLCFTWYILLFPIHT